MNRAFRIAFIVMYSEKFAMTGETHGVSVLAGVVQDKFDLEYPNILILDMYGLSVKDKISYILDNIKSFQPDVIGFSCPYGSYSSLVADYFKIAENISKNTLIIFGGALPTYIPEKYLELDKSAYVIQGEGEEAIVGVIDMYLKGDLSLRKNIPNICYYDNGKMYKNERKLVDLNKVVKPFREHLGTFLNKDSQIYVEHSRGCVWGVCSFCSRNLLSLDNCCQKYRLFSNERLLQDLQNLKQKGIRSVTFSDEDFCGSGLDELRSIVGIFKCINNNRDQILFDVSMNVNSVYSEKWSENKKKEYYNIFLELKKFGLRKVFLGVESGSVTQLKRYKKQQNIVEAVHAIRILENCNIEVEMGYIIFDPLCTLDEVKDDLLFLYKNDLAKYVSSLGSGLDLRLHMDAPYVKTLLQYEKDKNVILHSQSYDFDTLNYLSRYLDNNVDKMAQYVKRINLIIRPLYYPLKSISRYGQFGSLKDNVFFIKNIVVDIRNNYLKYLLDLVDCITDEGKSEKILLSIADYIEGLFVSKKEKLLEIAKQTNNIVLLELITNWSITLKTQGSNL